ncbi:hypothetical protein CNMCM8689_005956 [Aspergillus fumigatus]|nr:hypothetical protein CNMCM8689_005956 [Aspergillus fumigatus]KAF4282889.1 hypothetical protein CNMCM8686_006196 [Aspergillus fumigatus]
MAHCSDSIQAAGWHFGGEYTHICLDKQLPCLYPFPQRSQRSSAKARFPSPLTKCDPSLARRCGDGRSADVGMIGRGFASDRGFLAGAVHAPRKIVAEAGGSSDRSGFQAPPGAASTVRRHRHTYRFPIGVLHGCGDRGSGICSSSGGDTLPTSNTVVMIDRPKGYGVGMVTRSGLR